MLSADQPWMDETIYLQNDDDAPVAVMGIKCSFPHVVARLVGYAGFDFLRVATENTIRCKQHAMEYADGAPKILVPDNLKAAVSTPSQYEPGINFSFDAFSQYCRCEVVPARVKKPKDKTPAEAAAQLVYTRVPAAPRKRTSASVYDLNAALWEKLDVLLCWIDCLPTSGEIAGYVNKMQLSERNWHSKSAVGHV